MAINKTTLNYREKAKPYGQEDQPIDAYVVANYGDPGLTESTLFDFLSRFVIVMLNSPQKFPQSRNVNRIFALVMRPETLWISSIGGISSNTVNQKRIDYFGNVNVGNPSNFSQENIPKINRGYQLGEKISIKRLSPAPLGGNTSFFASAFSKSDVDTLGQDPGYYSRSHFTRDQSDGYPICTTSNNCGEARKYAAECTTNYVGSLNYSPSWNVSNSQRLPQSSTSTNFWTAALRREMFELFFRKINGSKVDAILQNYGVYNQHLEGDHFYGGDYYWRNLNSPYIFNFCMYYDLNLGGKQREITKDCQPLVVTSPDAFPITNRVNAQPIIFDPTFSKVSS